MKNTSKIGPGKDDFKLLLLWLEVRGRQDQENMSFKNGSWGIFVLQLEGYEKFVVQSFPFYVW